MNIDHFKKDFFASIVVFLVALPLCLGVALASGFSVGAGIISGIIGGIIVGSIAGCPLQVSGPSAGLILISYELIHTYGFEKFAVIVFAAGIIQGAFGLLGLGQWFRAVSPAIINGMLSGIGLSILFSQFYVMIDKSPTGNPLSNILSIPATIIHIGHTDQVLAALIGILTIGIIIIWNYIPAKMKFIPSALVAVIIAVLLSTSLHLPVKYLSISENIFKSVRLLNIYDLSCLLDYKIIIATLSIAFIASAETLIAASAIDKMSSVNKTNYNREILAQGVGNILAGLLGLPPLTGVMARSATNVQSGAMTRASVIIHGLWLLLFIIFLPNVLKLIPTSCLAAILVYTGYKLLHVSDAVKIFTLSKGEFIIYLITVIAIVSTSLLDGILIGVACSIIKNTYKSMKSNISVKKDEVNNLITIKISGNLTFLKLPQITNIIEKLEPKKKIIINFEKLNHIDHACIDILMDWSKDYKKSGGNPLINWSIVKEVYPNFGWENIEEIN
ncbi:MAG: SulP family inorganic anion transporter [bacterium]